MPRSTLLLWMFLYPSSWLVALAAWLAVFWFIRPRPSEHCSEVAVEGWRVASLVAAAPAALVAAELYLWLFRFDYQAPVGLTGLIAGAGWAAVALAAGPVAHALCDIEHRRHLVRAGVSVVTGLALLLVSTVARGEAWDAVVAHAAEPDRALIDANAQDTGPSAVAEVVRLEAYGYVAEPRAEAVLDVALATPADALRVARSAMTGDLVLDESQRMYFSRRLESGVEEDSLGAEAVAPLWALVRGQSDAADRTLRAYALAADIPAAKERDEPLNWFAATAALESGSVEVQSAVLDLLSGYAPRQPFPDPVLEAVAQRLEAPAPVRHQATAVLLQEGSRTALRAVLPLFTESDAPAWDVLRDNCPNRTQELISLVRADRDAVAQGARKVLAYVRQYCVRSRPVTG